MDRGSEPVPPRLDEFTFVEPGALFAPAGAFGEGINNLDQILLDPRCCPVPLDVSKPMLEMDWAWGAVQAEPSPVPHFEGEDIRGRADFEHHAVLARAVRSSGRNQKVVVLLGGKPIDVLVGVKLNCALLRLQQVSHHLVAIDVLFQPQVYTPSLPRIQKVVALILGIVDSKLLLNILGQRVHLKGEIAALHCVEKIEADGELGSKTRMHRFAEQLMRMLKYQVNGWDFYLHVAETKQKAILFRYAIKAPCVVLGLPRQVAHFFHPLSAPRSGIEEGHYAKRPVRRILQSLQMQSPTDHLGQIALICVQQKINIWNQIFLQAVGDTPVHKVGSFILCLRAFRAVL